MERITYTVIQTGEKRTVEVKLTDIATNGWYVNAKVWEGHYIELDLAHPERGWVLFPD